MPEPSAEGKPAAVQAAPAVPAAPAEPVAHAPDPAVPDRRDQRLTAKDRYTLIIAILSLVISVATFVLNRTEAHRGSVVAENQAAYNAYELGKRLALSFVVYHQVNRGDPNDVKAAREEALYKAREAQPYADSLGVDFSIEQLVARFRPEQGVFNESVIDAVITRLRASHPERVVDKFELGFSFFWLMVNIGAANTANPDFLPELARGYPPIARDINAQLEAMGVRQRLPPTMADPKAIFALAAETRKQIEATFDAAPRN